MAKTVFVTKFALTDGIRECQVKEKQYGSSNYIVVKWPGGLNEEYMFSVKDCSDTLDEAKKVADAMRVKKIASLKKQVKKLEALKF
jgi:hypothetical protein